MRLRKRPHLLGGREEGSDTTVTRRAVYGGTFAAWVALCALVFSRLVRRAAQALPSTIEDYARAPSFQALNFAVGYLPLLVALLIGILAVEHMTLRIVARRRSRGHEDQRHGARMS